MGVGGLLTALELDAQAHEEEEAQEELYIELYKSDKACIFCQDMLLYTDEVFVLVISAAQVTAGGLLYPPLASETGDFLFEPHFFCFTCWENGLEELRELYEDVPPIEDMYAVLECAVCESGIRDGETVAVASFGEIHLSHRNPNGESNTSKFASMDSDPTALCIACVNGLSGEVFDELWPMDIRQFNECREGTFARCWRYGCSAQGDCGNCAQEST